MNCNDYNAELRIPSNLIYLRPVRAFMKELAMKMGFSEKRANDIELIVDEVFGNAIEHGSVDCNSQILVRCFSTKEILKILVSDTGPGGGPNTNWIKALSKVIKEKVRPDTERGHGLLLVYSLADEMDIEPNLVGGIDVHLVINKEKQ